MTLFVDLFLSIYPIYIEHQFSLSQQTNKQRFLKAASPQGSLGADAAFVIVKGLISYQVKGAGHNKHLKGSLCTQVALPTGLTAHKICQLNCPVKVTIHIGRVKSYLSLLCYDSKEKLKFEILGWIYTPWSNDR